MALISEPATLRQGCTKLNSAKLGVASPIVSFKSSKRGGRRAEGGSRCPYTYNELRKERKLKGSARMVAVSTSATAFSLFNTLQRIVK
jgi:hypothetical protein